MNAYVDHNFLIYCVKDSHLRSKAVDAVSSGKVSFVLSPWHFYEIGRTSAEHRKELLLVVEALQPIWVLEHFDLQLGELSQEWGRFWGAPHVQLVPIGTLPYVAAPLLRTTPQRVERANLADYVEVFSRLGTRDIDPVLDQQQFVAATNQVWQREGRMTRQVKERVSCRYVTQQLASFHVTSPSHREHAAQIALIERQPLLVEKIKFFVEWGGMQNLRAWQVESMLTHAHWSGKKVLNANRQVDRQHAIPALAYCDVFITDDNELLKCCATVTEVATFPTARAVTAKAFFSSLH